MWTILTASVECTRRDPPEPEVGIRRRCRALVKIVHIHCQDQILISAKNGVLGNSHFFSFAAASSATPGDAGFIVFFFFAAA